MNIKTKADIKTIIIPVAAPTKATLGTDTTYADFRDGKWQWITEPMRMLSFQEQPFIAAQCSFAQIEIDAPYSQEKEDAELEKLYDIWERDLEGYSRPNPYYNSQRSDILALA